MRLEQGRRSADGAGAVTVPGAVAVEAHDVIVVDRRKTHTGGEIRQDARHRRFRGSVVGDEQVAGRGAVEGPPDVVGCVIVDRAGARRHTGRLDRVVIAVSSDGHVLAEDDRRNLRCAVLFAAQAGRRRADVGVIGVNAGHFVAGRRRDVHIVVAGDKGRIAEGKHNHVRGRLEHRCAVVAEQRSRELGHRALVGLDDLRGEHDCRGHHRGSQEREKPNHRQSPSCFAIFSAFLPFQQDQDTNRH